MFNFEDLKVGDELDYFGKTLVVSHSASTLLGLDDHPSLECLIGITSNVENIFSCSKFLNEWKGERYMERSACFLCTKGLCFKLKE